MNFVPIIFLYNYRWLMFNKFFSKFYSCSYYGNKPHKCSYYLLQIYQLFLSNFCTSMYYSLSKLKFPAILFFNPYLLSLITFIAHVYFLTKAPLDLRLVLEGLVDRERILWYVFIGRHRRAQKTDFDNGKIYFWAKAMSPNDPPFCHGPPGHWSNILTRRKFRWRWRAR